MAADGVARLARKWPLQGADGLALGCGDSCPAGFVGVDLRDLDGVDVVADITETPWPAQSDSVPVLTAEHVVEHLTDEETVDVLAEAARVVKPGGRIRVHVPIGRDAHTDPTHEQVWQWSTAEHYTLDGPGWSPGVRQQLPLHVAHRDVDARWTGPLAHLSPLLQVCAAQWPAWATYAAHEGELVIIYEVVEDA